MDGKKSGVLDDLCGVIGSPNLPKTDIFITGLHRFQNTYRIDRLGGCSGLHRKRPTNLQQGFFSRDSIQDSSKTKPD